MSDSSPTTSAAARSSWGGVALAVLAGICFSAAILFIRPTAGLSAPGISFYRLLFAFLTLSLTLPRWREPLHIRRYRRHIPALILAGIAIGATASLYIYAIQHTTVATAVLLVNTTPVYIALLSPWLLREPRPRYTWPGLVMAVTGIILIIDPAQLRLGAGSPAGVAAAALSGLTYSIPIIVGRRLRGQIGGPTLIWWGTAVAALMLLPFGLGADPAAVAANLIYLIPMGVISMAASYLLTFLALGRTNAQVVSTALLVEPVSGVLIGMLVFMEPVTALTLIGSILVLGSIVLIARPSPAPAGYEHNLSGKGIERKYNG